MKRAPTIRDVAKACGLSHMTVSNVMNNRPVSEATRKQVLEAMRALNYQPSAIARGLNRKPMDTLGVVLPHSNESPLSHGYYAPVLDGIMATAVAMHKDVTVYTGSLWTGDGEGMRRYRDGRTDGLLLVTPLAQLSLVRALLDVRVPFVCIGPYMNEPSVQCVTCDDAKASHGIVRHLAELGHRRIAYFSITEDSGFKGFRRSGFEKAMEREELSVAGDAIWFGGASRTRVRQYAEEFASKAPGSRPTAVYCFNDEIALALIEELNAIGVQVPEDISVVGFDDIPRAEKAGLTTAHQPMRDIGAHAARLLVERLNADLSEGDAPETTDSDETQPAAAEQVRTVYFDAHLVVRRTTAPPRS